MADRDQSLVLRRAAAVSLASTAVVVVAKLVAAALSGSISVLAEGLQSLLDVFMSLLVVVALRISAAPPDREHPYGHGKAEFLTSAFQMVLVLLTAGLIVWQASIRLLVPRDIMPFWGLMAMGYATVANLSVILYLRSVCSKFASPALQGEIEHLRTDTLSSIGILGGLLLYQATGWRPLDPLVAIVFTAVGAFFALRQLRRVLHPLMDGALPPDDIKKIESVLEAQGDVRGYHNVRTREGGRQRFVTIHVLLDDELPVVRAHELAEQIEDDLSRALGGALVTLHYEPYEAELEHRELEHDEPRPNL